MVNALEVCPSPSPYPWLCPVVLAEVVVAGGVAVADARLAVDAAAEAPVDAPFAVHAAAVAPVDAPLAADVVAEVPADARFAVDAVAEVPADARFAVDAVAEAPVDARPAADAAGDCRSVADSPAEPKEADRCVRSRGGCCLPEGWVVHLAAQRSADRYWVSDWAARSESEASYLAAHYSEADWAAHLAVQRLADRC